MVAVVGVSKVWPLSFKYQFSSLLSLISVGRKGGGRRRRQSLLLMIHKNTTLRKQREAVEDINKDDLFC